MKRPFQVHKTAGGIVKDVTRDNFQQLCAEMLQHLRTATFTAVDTEMSGLGDTAQLKLKDIGDRYTHLRNTVKDRALLSVGISFFIEQPTNAGRAGESKVYHSYTYNIFLFSTDSFRVDPSSLDFLVSNGFDFNRQISQGVHYYSGVDRPESADTHTPARTHPHTHTNTPSHTHTPTHIPAAGTPEAKHTQPHTHTHNPRTLFHQLCLSGCPLVLHNGFVDLLFLYQHLYAQLPEKFGTFVADCSALFAGGVVDTKYIADFHTRDPASFLEYLFRKRVRHNARRELSDKSSVCVMVETGTTGELEPVTSVAHFAPRDRSAQAAHLVGQLKRSAVDPGNTLTAGEVDTTRGTDMCVTTTTNTNNEASENHTKHTTTPEAKSSRNRSRKHPHVSDEHVHTTNTQASKTHTPPGTGQGTGEHAHAHAPVCTPTVLRVCQDYANHGHCRAGHTACLDSHDLDLILHLQDMGAVGLRVIAGSSGGLSVASSDGVGRTEQLSKRQLKRIKLKHKRASLQLVAKQPSVTAEANNTVVATTGNAHPHSAPFEDSSSIQARYSHRAGFDAFMTGYVYATDTLTYDTATLATMKNNIHLSYKQIPLHLTKSAYVNYSAGFLEKEKAAAIQTRAESYAADPK